MNNGKNFEKLVRLIQETLKDTPSTEIFSNYKIENKSGRKGEIDIFIQSSINNMEIKIAIECKDYRKPVSVEKIDAFNSKCQRIKGISKKVIVSSNGYQEDAYNSANFHDIELYKLSEISKDKISEWFPITQLKPNLRLQLPFKIHVFGDESDIERFQRDKKIVIHYFKEKESVLLENLLWENVIENQNEIKNYMLFDFIKKKGKEKSKIETRIPFSIDFEGIYISGEDGKKLEVSKIESEVVGWFDELPANITEARKYVKKDANIEASIVSLDVGTEEKADIIFTNKNDISIFHTKQDGKIYPMKSFCIYDTKTDKFTFENDKE